MTQSNPLPTRIELHQQQRILDVGFDDGSEFHYPCEYLRVYSPSEDAKLVREDGDAIDGKGGVGITAIEQVGNYAVRLTFDDGHKTGIYSWENLYDLGSRREQLWSEYQQALAANGKPAADGEWPAMVRVLYGTALAGRLGREAETLRLPAGTATLADLLDMLRSRGGDWQQLDASQLSIMLDEQVVDASTALPPGSEVALVLAPN